MPKCPKYYVERGLERKYRNNLRRSNYQQTADAPNTGKRWTTAELRKVMAHKVSDRKLSAEIGRSVEAIQIARARYKDKIA